MTVDDTGRMTVNDKRGDDWMINGRMTVDDKQR
jgi:hypothetical protein